MRRNNWMFKIPALALCASAVFAASCSDDDVTTAGGGNNNGELQNGEKYIVAATVDEASRIMTTDTIESGLLTKGQGIEAASSAYWIFKDKEALYRLVYNNGSAGTGSSYYLNSEGKLKEDLNFECQRFSTYGLYGEDIITISTGNSTTTDAEGNIAQGLLVNYINAKTGEMQAQTYPAENLLGNGEKVFFSGIVEANGKLYTSVVSGGMSKYGVAQWPDKVLDQDYITKSSGGSGSGAYTAGVVQATQYPDSAFVAIYDNSDFSKAPVIARTDKIGYATGRMRSQYYQTIWAADNGDIYVFSPGFGRLTQPESLDKDGNLICKNVQGKLPSGVVRIKKGETSFDPDYYVNLETIGNNHPIYRCWHISEDYFLLQFYTNGLDARGGGATELGVFKAEDKSLVIVSGLPAADKLTSLGTNSLYSEDGVVYVPVVTNDGQLPALYKITTDGKAVRALEVEADNINTVGVLAPRN